MHRPLSIPFTTSHFPISAFGVLFPIVLSVWAVTPYCFHARPVLLPLTPRPDASAETPYDLLITIQADGTTYLDTKWFPLPDLRNKLKELSARKVDRRIVIRADQRLAYRQVRNILSAVSDAGNKHLFLETRYPHPLIEAGRLLGGSSVDPVPTN